MTSAVCTFAGCRMYAIAYGRCVRHVAEILAMLPERDSAPAAEADAPSKPSSVVRMESISHGR